MSYADLHPQVGDKVRDNETLRTGKVIDEARDDHDRECLVVLFGDGPDDSRACYKAQGDLPVQRLTVVWRPTDAGDEVTGSLRGMF